MVDCAHARLGATIKQYIHGLVNNSTYLHPIAWFLAPVPSVGLRAYSTAAASLTERSPDIMHCSAHHFAAIVWISIRRNDLV